MYLPVYGINTNGYTYVSTNLQRFFNISNLTVIYIPVRIVGLAQKYQCDLKAYSAPKLSHHYSSAVNTCTIIIYARTYCNITHAGL